MKTKSLIIAFACIASSIILNAQDTKVTKDTTKYSVLDHTKRESEIKTIFGNNHSNGFYMSIDLGFSDMNKSQMIETGQRMAWIVDHSVAIGIFGTGFVSANNFDKQINGVNSSLSIAGGYGGFLIEPILFAKKPVHVTFPMMIGVGGAGYDTYTYNGKTYDYNSSSNGDAFMVLKAGTEVELNMLKFMRLALGVQYKYFYGMNLEGFGKNDLNGISGTVAFKFGKF